MTLCWQLCNLSQSTFIMYIAYFFHNFFLEYLFYKYCILLCSRRYQLIREEKSICMCVCISLMKSPLSSVQCSVFSVQCSRVLLDVFRAVSYARKTVSSVQCLQYYMCSFQLDSSVRSSVSSVPFPLSRVLCHVSYGLCPISCVLFAVFCAQYHVQTFQLSSRVQCPVSIVPFPLSRGL